MIKYNRHSLALNDEEQAKLDTVKTSTGFGVKKIFMAMVNALMPSNPSTPSATEEVKAVIVEEEI